MTTPAELVATAPAPTSGIAVSARQMTHGVGQWRVALEVADPQQGSSIEWHNFPPAALTRVRWRRGSAQQRGRYVATTPTVELWAEDDRYAPWKSDNSGIFGVHVPLEAGLIMRYTVFRVASGSTNLWWPQWIGRVRRWRDMQTAPKGGWRVHRVDVIDLLSELAQAPVGEQNAEAWRTRWDDLIDDSGWPWGVEVYGAETEDDGGGVTPVLSMPDRDEQDAAWAELEATLDPVGLVMRSTKRGPLIVHPPPWDTFHAGKFADVGLTVTGEEWVNPLLAYYPGGVRFSFLPVGNEVAYYPQFAGSSFGLDSDVEGVINELKVTFPETGGVTVYANDDPVSRSRFGRRPLPSRAWLARNDEVVDSIVESQAYTHYVAGEIRTNLDEQGTFPAIVLLDHLDPIEVSHSTAAGRSVVNASGPIRWVEHDVSIRSEGLLEWDAKFLADIDATSEDASLNPVEDLAVTELIEGYVEFGWTNPSQDITPTLTEVRIVQISTQWIELAYPSTSFGWLNLDPATVYTFEVRLLREVDGIVTNVSEVRSVNFLTPEATTPVGPGDGTVVVPAPDPDPDCDWEWKLEASDDGGDTWTTVDSGDESDLTYDAETDTYILDNSDFTFLDGHQYRECTRNICDSVPEDWNCNPAPYNPLCATPAQLVEEPFDTAVMFVPKICNNDILEAVSDTVAAKGPFFGGIGNDDDGNYTIRSAAAAGGVVVYGDAPNVPLEDGDRSIHWRGGFGNVEEVDPLLRVGRLRLVVIDVGAGDHRFAAVKSFAGGSITAIGTTTIAADTEYDVYATWDRDTATVAIFVAGVEEDTAEDAASYVNTPNLPSFSAKLPADSWCTELATWDSVVTVGPPGGTFTPLFSDDFNRADSASVGAGWNDPGNWSILGNRLRGGSINVLVQADQDCTVDHYCEVDVTLAAMGTDALCVRFASVGTATHYTGRVTSGGTWQIDRVVAGSVTVLDTFVETAPTLPFRIRLQAVGDQITLSHMVAGSPVAKVSVTDSTISTGNKTGMRASGGAKEYDNWVCGSVT